ncbi:hypothetical protein [Mycobacterium sp. TY813]|uniref:hypothetical protein n=1 Tax=Mycobacterium TaxID=1763 RepID=UPI0027417B50|nr:hypothetical protein [Mycobacterium sp. TY813]MDP7729538.1 hypothetical protein [Mycobacterium sp. TY813]
MPNAVATAPYRPLAAASGPRSVSQATAIEQARAVAEVQAAVVVAQQVPRDMQRAEAEMRDTCGRLAMANQAFYEVDNRGTGPSVHLMRELARIWGNVQFGVNELTRSDERGESEVQAWAWDVEANTRSSRTFIVPHARMRRGERVVLTDLGDIYLNNQNVGARAVRECIATILPRWFTEEAQDRCRATLEHGEGKPLPQRIDEMVKAFHGIGITERQIEARIGKKRGQWDAGDVAQMGIVYTSITRDGVNRDEAFPPIDADTVAELVGDAAPEKTGQAKRSAKVKDAAPPAPAADPGQGGESDASQGAEPPSGAEPQADSRDQDPPPSAADTAPGAPTANTPGQTDRVAKALAKATKGGIPAASRRDLADDITARLDEGGCKNDADRLAVLGRILDLGPGIVLDITDVNDAAAKKIRDTLTAWSQLGTLADMVGQILDAADMNAESGQQTLDGTN